MQPGSESTAESLTGRLRASRRSGDLADRDSAVAAAVDLLSAGGPASLPIRVGLVITLSGALREQWRETLIRDRLDAALTVITQTEALLAGDRLWSVVAAELARVQLEFAEAIDAGAFIRHRDPTAAEGDALHAQARDLAALAALSARAALASAPDPAAEADAAATLGDILRARGDDVGACHWLRRAVEIEPTAERRLRLALAHAERFDATGGEPGPAHIQDMFDAASASLDATPRQAFDADRLAAMFAANHGDWTRAAQTALRGLRRSEALRSVQRSDVQQRQWSSEGGTFASLAAVSLIESGDVAGAVRELEAATFIEFADRSLVPSQREGVDPSAAATVGEPLLYLITGPYIHGRSALGGRAVIVTADGGLQVVALPGLRSDAVYQQLSAYADRYAQWKRTRSPDAMRRLRAQITTCSDWVGSEVMAPVLAVLSNEVHAVTVVPDGLVGLLPLAAARWDSGYALDRVHVRITPSAAALASARRQASNPAPGTLLVGVSDVPDEPVLPYAALEIDAVAGLSTQFPPIVGLEEDLATIPAVAEQLAASGRAHFACHGLNRFDDPNLSSLYLAGGAQLTVADLLTMNLSGVRLAVLSACETGVPELQTPYEKLSMPNALMLAGVSGVVSSLWTVDDLSTMLLMTRFYEHLQDGHNTVAALGSAQKWLRDSTFEDIRRWADQRIEALRLADSDQADRLSDAIGSIRSRQSAPFAEPFYWAGFYHTGS